MNEGKETAIFLSLCRLNGVVVVRSNASYCDEIVM